MQNENYYKFLITEHYQANTIYLKKKYADKSFKEIYKFLELQEKEVLELQAIFYDYEENGLEHLIIKLFNNNKDPKSSYREYKRNLLKADTGKLIDKRVYEKAHELLKVLR